MFCAPDVMGVLSRYKSDVSAKCAEFWSKLGIKFLPLDQGRQMAVVP